MGSRTLPAFRRPEVVLLKLWERGVQLWANDRKCARAIVLATVNLESLQSLEPTEEIKIALADLKMMLATVLPSFNTSDTAVPARLLPYHSRAAYALSQRTVKKPYAQRKDIPRVQDAKKKKEASPVSV